MAIVAQAVYARARALRNTFLPALRSSFSPFSCRRAVPRDCARAE